MIKAAGFPWALAMAVVLVLVVELLFRSAEPKNVISHRYGEDEYYAAANHLDAYGPADVCFVGSSRAKEGITVPEARARIAEAGLPALRIANYACAGAHADESRALVDYLLARGRPRLILCGTSPRILRGTEPRLARSAIFWSSADWWRKFREFPSVASQVWPVVTRNYLSEPFRTLKYRRKPNALAADIRTAFEWHQDGGSAFSAEQILNGEVNPSPLNGALTGRQMHEAEVSLVNRPISEERVRTFLSRLLVDGEYVFGERRERELEALTDACWEAGVSLVFFEVPLSEILMRNLPEGAYEDYRARMSAISSDGWSYFVTVEDLELEFTDEDFAEQSHLNLSGATKLTRALTERVLIPELEESLP
jgi:hypothetical protein